MNGKGSTPRKVNGEKYRAEFDRIFRRPKRSTVHYLPNKVCAKNVKVEVVP